jgi:hypothetical protein
MTALIAEENSPGTSHRYRAMTRVSGPVPDDSGLERTTWRNRKMELFVWSRDGLTTAFELHHQTGSENEWSMLWTEESGSSFHRIDPDSTRNPQAGRAMIPTDAYQLPIHDLHAEFVTYSRLIDEPIRRVVLIRLSRATREMRS